MLQLFRPKRFNPGYYSHTSRLLLTAFCSTTTTTTTTTAPGATVTPPKPPPIQVLLTESAGRGVFATRRIGAGELIHTAKPVVSHPSPSSIHDVCYYCLRKLGRSVNSSSLSHEVSFCSDECRLQAKGFHEVERGVDWSAFDDHCRSKGLKYPLLVKRLACMEISGVASADSLVILQPAVLSSEMITQMEEEFDLLRSALDNAGITGSQMTFLTKQWYTGILARIRINAFRVELVGGSYEDLLSAASASVDADGAAGNAVYMLPSFYNHDCDPNANIIWIENADAKLKALRTIEAGEELRICYIDASMDYEARQTILSKGFGFQCNCPRCLSHD